MHYRRCMRISFLSNNHNWRAYILFSFCKKSSHLVLEGKFWYLTSAVSLNIYHQDWKDRSSMKNHMWDWINTGRSVGDSRRLVYCAVSLPAPCRSLRLILLCVTLFCLLNERTCELWTAAFTVRENALTWFSVLTFLCYICYEKWTSHVVNLTGNIFHRLIYSTCARVVARGKNNVNIPDTSTLSEFLVHTYIMGLTPTEAADASWRSWPYIHA